LLQRKKRYCAAEGGCPPRVYPRIHWQRALYSGFSRWFSYFFDARI